MTYFPSVIETTGRSSRAYDLPTKLLQDRIIYLGSGIDDESANSIIMQMLWLNADNPEADIDFYINSPGGSVLSGFAIKDIMYSIKCKVNTVGIGLCASMGAYLLASGTGTRKTSENCRIMLHSVSSGSSGTLHDMLIDLEETKYLQDKIMEDIASFSKGKMSTEDVKNCTTRDFYISPDKAIEMGIIDSIV